MYLFQLTLTYKENPALAGFMRKVADYIVNPLIGLMFAIALVVFLYGVFEYFVRTTDPKARETGSQHILWGLLGMVIMFGVYGIIRVVISTFGIDTPAGLL